MKDIRNQLIKLLKKGSCTPQISVLAKLLKTPSPTIHYNLKQLEKEGIIKKYSAVLDHKKAGEEICSFVLVRLSPEEYCNPERIGKELAKHPEVESVDICTGDFELIIKVRAKDIEAYYEFLKKIISNGGIINVKDITSLKQIKSEFI